MATRRMRTRAISTSAKVFQSIWSVEQSPQKFSLTLQQRVAVDEQANEMQNSTDETDIGLTAFTSICTDYL